MKRSENRSVVESIIRHSGFVVAESPSPEHPALITLTYRNNPDGSVRWLLPQGGRHVDVHGSNEKSVAALEKVCFALRLGRLIGDGTLKLYADPSTASYIRHKWHGIE
jgi:hypothetical protein